MTATAKGIFEAEDVPEIDFDDLEAPLNLEDPDDLGDPEDFGEVCGYSWDHTEEITYQDDEITQWICSECGAEGWDEFPTDTTSNGKDGSE